MKIHHLALRSPDPEALASFYQERLGLEVVRRQEGYSVWLRVGEAVLMVERAGEGEPPIAEGSQELVAFSASEQERATMEARLAQAGVPIEDRTGYTIYFRDPEGRRIGISSYPLRELG